MNRFAWLVCLMCWSAGSGADDVRVPIEETRTPVDANRAPASQEAAPAEHKQNSFECLSQAEMRELVAQKTVVAPVAAVRAGRAATGGGKVIRAALCHRDGEFLYHISTLHKDGRVMRVTVDGRSGKVVTTR